MLAIFGVTSLHTIEPKSGFSHSLLYSVDNVFTHSLYISLSLSCTMYMCVKSVFWVFGPLLPDYIVENCRHEKIVDRRNETRKRIGWHEYCYEFTIASQTIIKEQLPCWVKVLSYLPCDCQCWVLGRFSVSLPFFVLCFSFSVCSFLFIENWILSPAKSPNESSWHSSIASHHLYWQNYSCLLTFNSVVGMAFSHTSFGKIIISHELRWVVPTPFPHTAVYVAWQKRKTVPNLMPWFLPFPNCLLIHFTFIAHFTCMKITKDST